MPNMVLLPDSRGVSLRDAIVGLFDDAATLGLGAGLLEAAVFTVMRLVPGWVSFERTQANVSFDFLWIAPLVDLGFFIGLACLLVPVVVLLARLRTMAGLTARRVSLFVLGAVLAYVVLRVPGRLIPWAVGVMAVGVGARFAVWADPGFGARRLRRGWRRLAALVVLIGIVVRTGTMVSEARALRALPPAAPGTSNVLVIVLDTLRADHLSAYGYGRPTTPNLDRFGAEGVVFEQAMASSSWTLPSHASLFTGRHLHEHRTDAMRPVLDTTYPTLAEALAARGLVTAGFAGNSYWLNENSGLIRGFLHFEAYFGNVADAVSRTTLGREVAAEVVSFLGDRKPLGRKTAREVTDEFTGWLDNAPTRPFFVFLNYIDLHAPYASPPPFHTRFMTERQARAERGFSFAPPLVAAWGQPAEVPLLAAAYDGALSYLDTELGRLFEALRQRGVLDSTLIVITADHGEALGEHGVFTHGLGLYQDQIHVPLLMRLPGTVPAGVRVRTTVSTADVGATVLAHEQVSDGRLPGSSLTRFWSTSAEPAGEPVLSEIEQNDGHGIPLAWPVRSGRLRSVVADGWHLIEHQSGSVAIFHTAEDPLEAHDLSASEEGGAAIARLRPVLGRLAAESRVPSGGR